MPRRRALWSLVFAAACHLPAAGARAADHLDAPLIPAGAEFQQISLALVTVDGLFIGTPHAGGVAEGAIFAYPAGATFGGPAVEVRVAALTPAQGLVDEQVAIDLTEPGAVFDQLKQCYVLPDANDVNSVGVTCFASSGGQEMVFQKQMTLLQGSLFGDADFTPVSGIPADFDEVGASFSPPLVDGDAKDFVFIARSTAKDAVLNASDPAGSGSWTVTELANTLTPLPGTNQIVGSFAQVARSPNGAVGISYNNNSETYIGNTIVPYSGPGTLQIPLLEMFDRAGEPNGVRLVVLDSLNKKVISQSPSAPDPVDLAVTGDPVSGGGTLGNIAGVWTQPLEDVDQRVQYLIQAGSDLLLGVDPPPPFPEAMPEGSGGSLALERLLSIGDVVDGKTVSGIILGGKPLENGFLGLTLSFEDGSAAYYVAYNPVAAPVPALRSPGLWLVAVAMAVVAILATRRATA